MQGEVRGWSGDRDPETCSVTVNHKEYQHVRRGKEPGDSELLSVIAVAGDLEFEPVIFGVIGT